MERETREDILSTLRILIYSIALLCLTEQMGRAVKYFHAREVDALNAGYLYCYTDTDHSGWNRPENCLK